MPVCEGASELHINKATGEPKMHLGDIDEDGDMDLMFHFYFTETSLTCESTELTLTGFLIDGTPITGTEEINVFDPKNK